MASRVNVGVQKFDMPSNIYEMSKDAHKSSIPGVLGSLTDKLGTAVAARMAAERIAEDQMNKTNSEKAKQMKASGSYPMENYDEGIPDTSAYKAKYGVDMTPEELSLFMGDITEEDKQYDPFSESAIIEDKGMPTDVDPLFLDYELDEDLDTGRLNQEDKRYL